MSENLEHDRVLSRREALKAGGITIAAALSAALASALKSSTKGLIEDALADDDEKKEEVEQHYKMRGSSVHVNFRTTDGKTKECAGIRFNDYYYVVPKDVLADVKYVADITGVRIFKKKSPQDLREFKTVALYDQREGFARAIFAVTHPEIDFAILVTGGTSFDLETREEERREEPLLRPNYSNFPDKKMRGKLVRTLTYPSLSFLIKTGKVTEIVDMKRIVMKGGNGWKNGAITSHKLTAYFEDREGRGILPGSLAITADQTVCIITNIEQAGKGYVATFVPVGERSLQYLFEVALPYVDSEKRKSSNPISDECVIQVLDKSSIDAEKEQEDED